MEPQTILAQQGQHTPLPARWTKGKLTKRLGAACCRTAKTLPCIIADVRLSLLPISCVAMTATQRGCDLSTETWAVWRFSHPTILWQVLKEARCIVAFSLALVLPRTLLYHSCEEGHHAMQSLPCHAVPPVCKCVRSMFTLAVKPSRCLTAAGRLTTGLCHFLSEAHPESDALGLLSM